MTVMVEQLCREAVVVALAADDRYAVEVALIRKDPDTGIPHVLDQVRAKPIDLPVAPVVGINQLGGLLPNDPKSLT